MRYEDEDIKKQRDLWRVMYFIAISLVIISNRKDKADDKTVEEPKHQIEQTFDEGEHIISVPIDNPKKEVQTYEFHDGYKVLDIEDKYILYVNDEPVKCIGQLDNNEEVQFIEFGEPVELEETNTNTNTKVLKFVPNTNLEKD